MSTGPIDRRAGMLVPLFSMPSSRSWGIGEIGDLERLTGWLARSGQRLLQLLPITETSLDDPSPYGSISATAIDPQYISLEDMEDFAGIGGEGGLGPGLREALDRVRAARSIDYRSVRELKQAVLRRAQPRDAAAAAVEDKAKVLERGKLKMDPERHTCVWDNRPVTLTVTEFLILQSLAARPGVVKSRDALMDAAYDDQVYVDDRTIDSHIKRLRKKFKAVDQSFDVIETLYGVGYRFKE